MSEQRKKQQLEDLTADLKRSKARRKALKEQAEAYMELKLTEIDEEIKELEKQKKNQEETRRLFYNWYESLLKTLY